MASNPREKSDGRHERQKEIVVEQLKKTPIVKLVCEKAGIGRTTFYRWQDEDDEFRKAVDMATLEGKLTINDMSEYQLLSLIQSKHPSAIKYWLEHHHPDYLKKGRIEKEDPGPSVIILGDEEDDSKKDT